MGKTFETKARIIELLKKQKMTLAELSSELKLSKATVKQHLDELKSAGSIEEEDNSYFKRLKYYKAKGAVVAKWNTREASIYTRILPVLISFILVLGAMSLYISRYAHSGYYAVGPQSNHQYNGSLSNTSQIYPPSAPASTACPIMFSNRTYTHVSLMNYSGFGLYNVSAYPRQDFLLSPGSSGTLVFSVNISGNGATENVTNNFIMYHQVTVSLHLNITESVLNITKYSNGTMREGSSIFIVPAKSPTNSSESNSTYSGQVFNFPNGTRVEYPNATIETISGNTPITWSSLPTGTTKVFGYTECYNYTGSKVCMSSPGPAPGSSTINQTELVQTTPGLNVSITPANETVSKGSAAIMRLTIQASQDAAQGTYLLGIRASGEFCRGGPYYFVTVGSKPYSPSAGQNPGGIIVGAG